MSNSKLVAKDHYLFREGDQPDAMYIVKSGGFAITKTKGTQEIILAEIATGAMVGEMALFDRKPRSANVKATKDSEVLALPYDGLSAQLEQLPVWVKAIMRTMNENLREANKKIKMLENPVADEDRFPPHVVNKLISIINLVGHRYGKPEGDGSLVFRSVLIRNYTIQIFQEATNKMQSMIQALAEMNYMKVEDLGDGTQKITNLKPNELFGFVDWYNEWLFKQDKDRLPALSDQEVKVLNALLLFADKVAPDAKGFHKVNLNDVQNESMKEVGSLIKVDDCNSLIEKKYLSEKIMDEQSLYLMIKPDDIRSMAANWTLVNTLKKKLR